MAKEDVNPHLDIERQESCDHSLEENLSSRTEKKRAEKNDKRTVVKNAHATGLGAIGRNSPKPDTENCDFNAY